jgi:hypothetical protein
VPKQNGPQQNVPKQNARKPNVPKKNDSNLSFHDVPNPSAHEIETSAAKTGPSTSKIFTSAIHVLWPAAFEKLILLQRTNECLASEGVR